ncbi:hypothetical protein [Deinococcus navajonensis]|uniref:Uncharacterized protein n=1 Tax=Deinococcus navajonensis TaxID=309884 RepID=A0ABV8XH69_9DEIO
MKLSFEDALNELLREGFVYFTAAQHHVHAHKDLESAELTLDIRYGLGMFDDIEWWMQEQVRLFPLGSYDEKGRESYDLYVGEDEQLYAVDSAFCWSVHRIGRHVRDGLECIAAGLFGARKQLIQPIRPPE